MFSNNEDLSQDTVFDVLSSARRRETIDILREEETPIELTGLAEIVAARENDTTVEALSSQDRKRVYVSLYQTHLPKLEDVGIIEYDEDGGEITLTDRAVETDTYLTPATEATYPWELHYLALALVSGIGLVLSFVGFPVISAIPPLWLGVGITLAFAVSTIVQFVGRRRRREQLPRELNDDW